MVAVNSKYSIVDLSSGLRLAPNLRLFWRKEGIFFLLYPNHLNQNGGTDLKSKKKKKIERAVGPTVIQRKARRAGILKSSRFEALRLYTLWYLQLIGK
jgi:hypothetical protein